MFCCRTVVSLIAGLCLGIPVHGQETKKKPAVAPGASDKRQTEKLKVDVPLSSLTEFSATMVGGILGNVDELKIYRSGNLMRTEMLDGKNYMVTDLDKRETWVVLPDRCAHDPRPSINTIPFSTFRSGQNVQRNLIGTEDIQGHLCQVEELTVSSPHGQAMKMKMWEATDLSGFPIKIEVNRLSGDPVTITYKDVTIGKPDAALFKHPKICDGTASKTSSAKKGSKAEASKAK